MAALPPPQAFYSVPQVIDYVWRTVSAQINSGVVDFVTLPYTFKAVIGQHGFDVIATRFRFLIQAPVTTIEDPVAGTIRIIPTRNPEGKSSIRDAFVEPKVALPIMKKAKVPRPPNAFILYRQHHHPLIKAKNPDMHNNQISIVLGSQWKAESESTRARFRSIADSLKQKHLMEHPEYSYQPRKPSDKKRRMTPRKAAVLTGLSSPSMSTSIGTPVTGTPNFFDMDFEQNEVPTELPKLVTNSSGNIVLNLGDEDLGDKELAAMIEAYNKDIPGPRSAQEQRLQASTPPVLYAERSEAAQNDFNFYSSMIDWDAIDKQHEAAIARVQADLDTNAELYWTDTDVSLAERTRMYDAKHEYLYDAELARMSSVFE